MQSAVRTKYADKSSALCPADDIIAAEATTVVANTGVPIPNGNILTQTLVFTMESGLSCNDADQTSGACNQYAVRYCCQSRSQWNNWEAWGTCSEACNGGIKERTRSCANDYTDASGQIVNCLLAITNEETPCNTQICPVTFVSDCNCPTSFACLDTCGQTESCIPFEEDNSSTRGGYLGMCFPNRAGTCKAHNDPYVFSFDGATRLNLYGHAKYLLSEYSFNPADATPGYEVIIETGAWRGLTSVSRNTGVQFRFAKPGNEEFIQIDFEFPGDSVNIIEPTLLLSMDGVVVAYPNSLFDQATYFKTEITRNAARDDHISTLRITTWSNIVLYVQVDYYYYITLTLPGTYAGKNPIGLCGNFNQDRTDDWMMRSGVILDQIVPFNHYQFAKDYEIADTCTNNCGRKRRADEINPWEVTCPNKAVTDPICDRIFEDSFWDECRAIISPEDQIEVCKNDYCLISENDVLLSIIDTYAMNCRSALPRNSEVFCNYLTEDWFVAMEIVPDTPVGFQGCATGMEWSGCAYPSKDMMTCEDHKLKTPTSKTELPTGGCICMDGYFYENGVCIEESGCPAAVGSGQGFDTTGDGVGNGLPETPESDDFNPCPSRVCWDYNSATQTCSMKSKCSSLDCKFNQMDIEFQSALFGMTDDSSTASFALPLLSKPAWNTRSARWSLSCPLGNGNCGMAIETENDKLKFTVTIEPSSTTIELGNVNVMSVTFGQAKFVCLYDTEFELSSDSFDVSEVSVSGEKTGTGSFFEGFGMMINNDEDGATPLGSMMQVVVTWLENFEPVTFFLTKCSIGHGVSEVEIISGGCLSETLFVTEVENTKSYYSFKYRTFLVDGETGNKQDISCQVKLCLGANPCGKPTSDEMCPTGKSAFQYSVGGSPSQ